MLISKSKEKGGGSSTRPNSNESIKNSFIINKIVKNKYSKLISLPNITQLKRRKWVKSKEAVSKFFDELDYNNQIQSSYELTLLERQKNYDKNNVAQL